MALSVVHATQTVIPDDPAYPVGADEWNAAHTVSGTVPIANGGTNETDAATAATIQIIGRGHVA